MQGVALNVQSDAERAAGLAAALRARVTGEVRFDALSRTLYATDASVYEITPVGVVLPKSIEDVVAVVGECHLHGTCIIARGAGTALTGAAIGPGVILDFSRHMNRIGRVDVENRTVEVEPGVVLDELNAYLAPHGLYFAPDVAPSSRATIGGMIANNSCGAHSVAIGRTVDHLASLTMVNAAGEVVRFDAAAAPDEGSWAAEVESALARVRDEHFEEIRSRFPDILRSNGGYGLDRLGSPGERASAIRLLCGSEGTLGVVVGATLKLLPLPKRKGLVVLHFASVLDALSVTPAVLKHDPAAVELIDKMIIDAGRSNPVMRQRCDFIEGDPGAFLAVEFYADDDKALAPKIDGLCEDPEATTDTTAVVKLLDARRQGDVWNLRKAGLGLLMSRPGDTQPHAFVEDTAVSPARLRDYIERFGRILEREGVEASYYAHASVGCIHVKPGINLKSAEDIGKMHRIAEEVTDLAIEFGGTMTGEHGDGISRSCWLERLYGREIIAAFGQVKRIFDPENIFNPHKIVDPLPMTEHLRYGPEYREKKVKTLLDFSAYGGMAGLAGMCSGVGQCRQRLVGTMCPSYVATDDETHTTRARANALRVALSNRGLLEGLDDPHLREVLDLCISCKACKSECPTGVDMARLKAEYLSHRHLRHGVPKRARLVAEAPHRMAWPGRFPRLANLVMQSRPARAVAERLYGIDRRVPPPRFARQTFRRWFRRHRRKIGNQARARGNIVYFVDTWTNYFTPEVGIAAVTLLERAGFEVLCPQTFCCGRPAISQGLLTDARQLAEMNVRRLGRFVATGGTIVGTEPSCVAALVDEYPQLVRTRLAETLSRRTHTLDAFLSRLLGDEPEALRFGRAARPVMFHGHCHQKALWGTDETMGLLSRAFGAEASLINSGCCGMAGAFGHEAEHYDVARAIGEQRLFPAVRERGAAEVAVTGFSCRHQIEHHTGVHARHVVELLGDALA